MKYCFEFFLRFVEKIFFSEIQNFFVHIQIEIFKNMSLIKAIISIFQSRLFLFSFFIPQIFHSQKNLSH